jgi:predicted nucleotidyltransferase
MRLQELILPATRSDYHAPIFLENTGSFSPKIDLSQPFFEGFTYKHLHHLVKELKDDISTFRVMAYLFKHGADVVTMSGYIKEDNLELVAYLERRLGHGNLLNHSQQFRGAVVRRRGSFGSVITPFDVSGFHQKAELLCDALTSFGFLVRGEQGDYKAEVLLLVLYGQAARGRIPVKKAWSKIPEIIKRAQAFNDTRPPVSIACVLLFGSLTRNPETVDDIDVTIVTHRQKERPGKENANYEEWRGMCRDYVKENGLTVRRNSIMDGPTEDVQRHIKGRFSKLDRISISDATKESIIDKNALFYALYVNPDLEAWHQEQYDGVIDVKASVIESKVVLQAKGVSLDQLDLHDHLSKK